MHGEPALSVQSSLNAGALETLPVPLAAGVVQEYEKDVPDQLSSTPAVLP